MRVSLFVFSSELSSSVRAASQSHTRRQHLVLRLFSDGVSGWGEVSPQPFHLNGDPSFEEVARELGEYLLPLFADTFRREGAIPHWSRISRFAGSRSASPWAAALVEMAALDWLERNSNRAIAEQWPPRFSVPVMQTVGALDDEWPIDLSRAAQLRLKVDGRALSDRILERLRTVAVPILLDYNCSTPQGDEIAHHLRQLENLVEVVAVEQPYAPGNVVDHSLLAAALPVAVSLDEGIRSARDISYAARYAAATFICLKPARLGGYAVARTCAALALELGLRPYIGGFFEGPLGRSANRILAQNSVTEPSDIATVVTKEQATWGIANDGWGVVPSAEWLEQTVLLSDIKAEA